MNENAHGLGGFFARRIRDLTHLAIAVRFVKLYLTKARQVRIRYREAQASGKTLWLDDGPFRESGS